MIYDEPSGERICRPLRGRRPASPPEDATQVSGAHSAAILAVVDRDRRWGPKQVHAELRLAGHSDIPLAEVEAVFDYYGLRAS